MNRAVTVLPLGGKLSSARRMGSEKLRLADDEKRGAETYMSSTDSA